MDIDRAGFAAAQAASQEVSRAQDDQQPLGVDRDFVCLENRYPVRVSATGVGLRFGNDMLAALARLARSRVPSGRVWGKLHQLVLSLLQEQGVLDWSVAIADSSSVRAVGAGKKPAQARLADATQAPNTICSPMPGVLDFSAVHQ